MPVLHITIADLSIHSLNSHHGLSLNSHPDRQVSIQVKVSNMASHHQYIYISITEIANALTHLFRSPHSSLIKVITHSHFYQGQS